MYWQSELQWALSVNTDMNDTGGCHKAYAWDFWSWG